MDTIDLPETEIHAPTSVEEAVALLAEREDDAKVLAGGQSLLVLYRSGFVTPSVFVSLRNIGELTAITSEVDGGLRLGAAVTQYQIIGDPAIERSYRALVDAAHCVSSPQVRRRGTLGGNLCHADPTADPPAALIALGASVEIASVAGRRLLPIETFFTDYMETVLAPDELLTAIVVPPGPTVSVYEKHRLRGIDTAIVGVGIGLVLADDGMTCESVRIGLAGAGTTPLRASGAEDILTGVVANPDAWEHAGRIAAEECEPLDDTEATAWYRRQMVERFVQRTGLLAMARANSQKEISA